MKNYCCSRIDDYLDDDLEILDLDRFLESLESCVECRESVDAYRETVLQLKQQWRAIDVPKIAPGCVPPSSTRELEKRQRARSSHTGLFGIQLAMVVASVVLVVGVTAWFTRLQWQPEKLPDVASHHREKNSHTGRSKSNSKQQTKTINNRDVEQLVAKAAVEFPSSFIGVRLDSPDEDFTFINVYQTLEKTKRNSDPKGENSSQPSRNHSLPKFNSL